jgi:PelA/Pel-15E family pectate lyase
LVADPAAPPLWSRFNEIGSNKALFGDRDGSVSYDVRTISRERRQGYGWYKRQPGKALKKYAEWKQREK